MERRDAHPELMNLAVGDGREAAALDQQLAILPPGAQQAERTVTDAADHAARGPGGAHLRAHLFGLTEIGSIQQMIYGLAIVLLMIFRPSGLWGYGSDTQKQGEP